MIASCRKNHSHLHSFKIILLQDVQEQPSPRSKIWNPGSWHSRESKPAQTPLQIITPQQDSVCWNSTKNCSGPARQMGQRAEGISQVLVKWWNTWWKPGEIHGAALFLCCVHLQSDFNPDLKALKWSVFVCVRGLHLLLLTGFLFC